jgi:hypothetical protein
MLTGTATPDEFLGHAATIDTFAAEAVTLPGAEVLQAAFEIRIAGRESSLPPGLHPTNPPTFVLQVWRCPDSPWGAFSLAQARVGARSGLRPRGFVEGCACDNDDATAALRAGWGLPVRRGEVRLHRRYDGTDATVTLDGSVVIEVHALGPVPLAPDDIAYPTSAALAHTPRGLRIVQVDADVDVARAERLTARLVSFDAAPWVHPSVEPYHPVSASIADGSITLGPVRYLSRPDTLAFTGTETVGD